MTFQDRVTATIKECAPSVEFIFIGDSNTGEGYAWTHSKIVHESQCESAEDMAVEDLVLRIKKFKSPDLAFVRLADSGTKMDENTGNIINVAIVRYALGYKI